MAFTGLDILPKMPEPLESFLPDVSESPSWLVWLGVSGGNMGSPPALIGLVRLCSRAAASDAKE